MVVYVRLDSYEAKASRERILAIKESLARIEEKAIDFNNIRKEKKARGSGMITRTRALESEIAKLKELLPKIEVVKEKEKILETKGKERPAKQLVKAKLKLKEKKKYQEELEEIRKKIAEL